MAKRGDEDDDKRPTSDEDATDEAAPKAEDEGDRDESASDEDESDEDESDDDDAKDEDESDEDESDEDESDDDDAKDEDESDDDAKDEPAPLAASAEGDESEAEDEDEDGEEVAVAGSLGVQRYVYSAFFSSVMLGGFVLGRALETLWSRVAVSDWAVRNVPAVTGVPDESKATYSFIVAGVIAVVVGIQTFRKEHVRKWSEEVSSELLKVKWPTRKEVYASTVVVLATSAIAVAYLFLLDRFWGFITDKIYGLGS